MTDRQRSESHLEEGSMEVSCASDKLWYSEVFRLMPQITDHSCSSSVVLHLSLELQGSRGTCCECFHTRLEAPGLVELSEEENQSKGKLVHVCFRNETSVLTRSIPNFDQQAALLETVTQGPAVNRSPACRLMELMLTSTAL